MQSHCVIDERTDVWVRSMWLGTWEEQGVPLYYYGGKGRRYLVSVAWISRTTVCLPISLLPSWEPSLILSSGSGVISVAELGELWLEAIAKQGLEKPPANTVPLGEVGIFLAYMVFFYRSNK